MSRILPGRTPGAGHARAYAMLFLVAICVIALDQMSKAIVTSTLGGGNVVDLFGGIVRLDYTSNTGAAFGLFRAGGVVFALVAIVVCVSIVALYGRLGGDETLSRIGLGLVLGGAVGNLTDRVRLGHVVDFIDLGWWPVFNVADSAVLMGVAVLILSTLDRPGAPSPQ